MDSVWAAIVQAQSFRQHSFLGRTVRWAAQSAGPHSPLGQTVRWAGGMFRPQRVGMWLGCVGSDLAHDRAPHLAVRCTLGCIAHS